MLHKLTVEQEELNNLMSEISERCYTASWMTNLEYILWDAVINGSRKYGYDLITERDIEILKKSSSKINGWIMMNDLFEETYIELTLWKGKFSQEIARNPSILKG